MKPFVKICGITNLEDALLCASEGADMLGFIFYKSSPRYIEPGKAATIIKHLPGFVIPVGIFVNEKRESVETIIRKTSVRIVQFSGDETPGDCDHSPVEAWKSFRIRARKEIESVEQYSISAAVLDGAPANQYGGSGQLPDFEIALEMKKHHPLILAGGLGPENVVGACELVQPYGVDINSGVEIVPGKKDHKKIRRLFDNLGK